MKKDKKHKPKRIIVELERVKTFVDSLKIGMYVESLDRPWNQTPFEFQGFTITDQHEIDQLQAHCQYVFIDIARSVVLNFGGHRPSTSTQNKRVPYELPKTSAATEYPVASGHYEKGIELSKTFMQDVADNKPINVEAVKASVSECIHSILRNPDAMLWLSKIRSEDQYTSEHCFNVCLLAVVFGRHLGIQGDELMKLGICGMLHDVGKMHIPTEILNKKSGLNKIEFSIMRTHVEHGRDTLTAQNNMLQEAIDVAYSHHETMDGLGYPRKLSGNNISEISRIISICDVYDAITSDRVYKKARSSYEALRILYENRDSKFDGVLVEQFIQCMGLYPPGSLVELMSGEVAIVIASNYEQRRFPKILVVLDENKKLCQETVVDLTELAKAGRVEPYMVKSTLSNGTFGIRFEEYVKRGLKVG